MQPCCRPDYLRQTLDSLSQLAGLERMAVYISQDGNDSAVAAVVQGSAASTLAPPRTRAFQHWQHERNPQLGAHQASLLLAGVPSRMKSLSAEPALLHAITERLALHRGGWSVC